MNFHIHKFSATLPSKLEDGSDKEVIIKAMVINLVQILQTHKTIFLCTTYLTTTVGFSEESRIRRQNVIRVLHSVAFYEFLISKEWLILQESPALTGILD